MRSLIRTSYRSLLRKNVPEASNSIKLAYCQHIKNKPLTTKNIQKFKTFIKLRSCHYPLQYLCSCWNFRELRLTLVKPVLIPRFQSEYMITIIIEKIKIKYQEQSVKALKFVDYGCGSGALGLSLIKQLNISGILLDISKKCIQLSTLNAAKNQINMNKVQFIHADMQQWLQLIQTTDIIISNPPYLSQHHYHKYIQPQIKLFQDKSALVADDNGMKYIKMMIKAWEKRNKNGILMLQFDGRKLQDQMLWVEEFVVLDQYGKRRYILLQK